MRQKTSPMQHPKPIWNKNKEEDDDGEEKEEEEEKGEDEEEEKEEEKKKKKKKKIAKKKKNEIIIRVDVNADELGWKMAGAHVCTYASVSLCIYVCLYVHEYTCERQDRGEKIKSRDGQIER